MRYEYTARVVRVLDGDTMDVDVDLGLRVTTRARIRLRGIAAPELRTKGDEGELSRDGLLALCPLGSLVRVRTYKDRTEKYGRWLGEVWIEPADGDSVNTIMVKLGLAQPYDG